jgi:hypothetical protein
MRGTQYAEASRFCSDASGILDHPLEPVIGLAEGETRWRVMTQGGMLARLNSHRFKCQTASTQDVIASQRVGAKRRRMAVSVKQSIAAMKEDGLLRRFRSSQ